MNNDQRRNVMVVMPPGLADDSLRAAHDAGMSRSELVRRLLADHLSEKTEQT
jgi:hypothetical protein